MAKVDNLAFGKFKQENIPEFIDPMLQSFN
jgi:hypothetical protein